MSTRARTLNELGGAISIGGEKEEQEPFPDGEVMSDDDEPEDEDRDPEPAGDDDAPRRN